MVDVRRLRVLCEVARQRSFSGAAASLGYTQPAVSRQVALLEAELGTQLVLRLPQGVVLTDAGRLLVERGETLLGGLRALEDEIKALAGLEGGRLRLAAFSSACSSIVPLAVAMFRERHPAVELSVVMSEPQQSLAGVRAGDFDLALSNDPAALAGGSALPASSAVAAVHLFDDPMLVALPPDHRLANEPALGLDRFADEPWMLATPSTCPDWRLLQHACHAAGFEPRVSFQNDDYAVVLGFVAAGLGVAVIPDMVARTAPEGVLIRALDPPPPPRQILALTPSAYRSAATQAMLEVLRELSKEWIRGRVTFPDMVLAGTGG